VKLFVEGVGLVGPGLADWPGGAAVLAGVADHQAAPVVLAASELLPPAERRRMTETVKLALAVGSEAVARSGRAAESLASVFASSGGDGATITAILEILASEQREVSPTRFHNSVHNAPSGYWSIATHSRESSTSLAAYDFSFAAGLLEAASLAVSEGRPVLLVSYDVPYSTVLRAARPIRSTFGTALVLSPERRAGSIATLTVALERDVPETTMPGAALEALRQGNPAARALPLLAALAGGVARRVTLALMAGNCLTLDVAP
jgi:hypothetical protein